MEYLLKGAADRGCVEMTLEVRKDNESAICFYRNLGFRDFGMITGYYADGMAALRMKRKINLSIAK